MRISLFEIPMNNHGCSGFWVDLETTSPTEAVVVNGGSCNSCWQMGHDSTDSPIKIGTKVGLPEEFRNAKVWHFNGSQTDERSQQKYFNSIWLAVNWENAKEFTGYSHNELVDDLENPLPDTTLVRPQDLVIL